MGLVDPQGAVDYIWEEFDEQYKLYPSAANDLVRELQGFKVVSQSTPEKLWKFASTCRQARLMANTPQGGALGMLDFIDGQRMVTEKMDPPLKD